jgi:sugar phosphate isomerase/epimerase
LRAAEGNAILAQRLGLNLVSFHAGFLPHEPGHPLRLTMIDRLRQVAGVFAARGVGVALETGQESATTLLSVLAELNHGLQPAQRIGVNFDPANMILYGMGDPIDSLSSLMPHVRHIHIKDATPSNASVWGTEVPVGAGSVDWNAFFGILKQRGYSDNLAIEREAGDQRIEDVRRALAVIQPLAPTF